METMVAATILGMAVASTMAILGGARSSLLRAERRWNSQHQVSQATELYLLGGPNPVFPDGLLQSGCVSSCELYPVEDIHEEALEPIKEWILAEYHIAVRDADGNLLDETWVRKVLKEEDVE